MDFHTVQKIKNVSGPQVRKIRYQLKLSQPELAARCQRLGWDVSRDIIARIELQTRWVGDFELALLANALKVSIADLIPAKSLLEEAYKR